MRRFITVLAVCALAVGLPWPAVALERTHGATGAEVVFLRTPGEAALLADVVVGDGIPGTGGSRLELPGFGRVAWREVRDDVDAQGGRHRFYRQYLVPEAEFAAVLQGDAVATGVELVGGELGLHYDADGNLEMVFGTQFDDVQVLAAPRIVTRTGAVARLRELAAAGERLAAPDSDLEAAVETRARLVLESTGDGRTFRFVWAVPAVDPEGEAVEARIDAATGELLGVARTVPHGTCWPDSSSTTPATGYPENPSLPARNVWATATSDPSVYDSHRAADATVPEIVGYQGADTKTCSSDGVQGYYKLLKVGAGDGGGPVYGSPSRTPLEEDQGADAMWFTYQTMQTFKALGRNGWDGSGSPARFVVSARTSQLCWDPERHRWYQCYGYNNAFFAVPGSVWALTYGPASSVVLYRGAGSWSYGASAALDIVAHEWGHGVIYTSAGWDYGDSIGAQLHEGFADVIGYTVEWDHQPPGSGWERADWMAGEDTGAVQRRVDVDDGAGGYEYHKDDGTDEEAHHRGHQLAVAFRLLAVGGQNPVCSRLPGLSGCDVSVTALGLEKARRIFFHTLTHYCTSSTGWEDLPDLMILAAYHLYRQCPIGRPGDPALEEQRAVDEAFTAIGYPGSGYHECPY